MDKPFTIETERLILRPHQLDDVPFMVQFSSDPEVTRYTRDGALTESEAKEIVHRLLGQFKELRMGRFLVIEKSSGERIGWSGLSYLKDRNVIDLGYRFIRNKWGLGYATESARACLKYGFDELKIPEITARADIRNEASIHVLKKLMMAEDGAGRDESGEFTCFKILRPSELKTFKEISIGGMDKEQLISQLTAKGIQFNKYAHVLFDHPSFAIEKGVEKVKLAKVRLSDLRITKPCFFQEVVEKASDLGLKLCPIYLGAFLRLAYLDQPEGPYLTIASTKPEKDENYPNGFYLRNNDGSLWLRGYRASDDYEWPIDHEFIFSAITYSIDLIL